MGVQILVVAITPCVSTIVQNCSQALKNVQFFRNLTFWGQWKMFGTTFDPVDALGTGQGKFKFLLQILNSSFQCFLYVSHPWRPFSFPLNETFF